MTRWRRIAGAGAARAGLRRQRRSPSVLACRLGPPAGESTVVRAARRRHGTSTQAAALATRPSRCRRRRAVGGRGRLLGRRCGRPALGRRPGGARKARRMVTLGSPHHGTDLAGAGRGCARRLPGRLPAARPRTAPCWPANPATRRRPARVAQHLDRRRPVVTPPDQRRLAGAREHRGPKVCPGSQVDHGGLPTDPAVRALGWPPRAGPSADRRCPR